MRLPGAGPWPRHDAGGSTCFPFCGTCGSSASSGGLSVEQGRRGVCLVSAAHPRPLAAQRRTTRPCSAAAPWSPNFWIARNTGRRCRHEFPLSRSSPPVSARAWAQLTRDRPKPLIEVAGRPLIAHALDAAREAGCLPDRGQWALQGEMLGAWLAEHAPDVHFLHETPDILDSGGAVKNALALLGPGPIFTLNADAVWDGAAPLTGSRRAVGARANGRTGRARPPGRCGGAAWQGGDFSLDGVGVSGGTRGRGLRLRRRADPQDGSDRRPSRGPGFRWSRSGTR
jgi:hypothetical protein